MIQTSNSIWEKRKLYQLLSIQNGYAFDSDKFSKKEGFPIIRIRDLKTNQPSAYFVGEFDDKWVVKRGDLLIGMDGEFRCHQWQGPNALLNQRICRLYDFYDVIPEFVLYGINKFLSDIELKTPYVTVKHISSNQIREIVFPVPPIPVQQDILKSIKKSFRIIEEANRIRQESFIKTHSMISASLSSIFNDTLEEKYGLKSLQELFDNINSGSTPRKLKGNYVITDGIPFIKVEHIMKEGWVRIDERNSRINRILHEESMKRSQVFGNSILVNIVGPPLGKVGIIGQDIKEANINQAIVGMSFPKNAIPKYVWFCLRSPRYNQKLVRLGVGIRQSNINTSQIRSFMIPAPPLEKQERIVEYLDKIFSLLKKVMHLQAITKQKTDEMKGSVLAAAYDTSI